MKKALFLFIITILSATAYGQSLTSHFGLSFEHSKADVISKLNSQDIAFSETDKDKIEIKNVICEGSKFDKCTLLFKKDQFIEADYEQVLNKDEERIIAIKFPSMSKTISEKYLMKKYMEKTRNGYYSGWSGYDKTNVLLRWEKKNDNYYLNLIFSSKKLF